MNNLERSVIMRLRNLKNRYEIIDNCPFLVRSVEEYIGKWHDMFPNSNNPIHVEIGMGKGQFIYNMAKTYPDINFIGVEKYDNVMARAINKMTEPLPNLLLINTDACNLKYIFDHEIDVIYLNFSDPWPKNRHELRRLTSKPFLEIYDVLFNNEKVIIQKTDNIGLFGYSISSLSKYGYTLERVSLDLHHEEDIPNIMTEYEEKFSNDGVMINYLYAKK